MVKLLVNNELEWMWKEAVVANFRILLEGWRKITKYLMIACLQTKTFDGPPDMNQEWSVLDCDLSYICRVSMEYGGRKIMTVSDVSMEPCMEWQITGF
jgi:hypothetical protein